MTEAEIQKAEDEIEQLDTLLDRIERTRALASKMKMSNTVIALSNAVDLVNKEKYALLGYLGGEFYRQRKAKR